MLLMETYLFYCSVRLGVMVISIVAFISTLVPSLLIFIFGLDVLNTILKLFNDDDHFRNNFIVRTFTNMVDNDSDKLLAIFQFYLFSHMATTVAAFYGALKIKKYYLIPLAIFEFTRFMYCLISHIMLMTVCKNKLNLGILITVTLGGGFVILFLGYNWGTIVALYQIITLIKSERYKSVYGDDPFHPLIPKTYNPLVTENVRVLITPNSSDVDEQKQRNALNGLTQNTNVVQPVIAVLPANYSQNISQLNGNNKKWMKSRWASPSQNPLIVAPVHNTPPISNDANDNSYSVAYSNWQWSELAPAVSARNKKNIYKHNWKY